jgi:amidase
MGHERNMGHLRAPTAGDIERLGAADLLQFAPGEAETFASFAGTWLESLDALEEVPELDVPLRHHVRDPGRHPTPEEDPFNAFVRLCRVEGAPDGPLAGRRIGIKDNLAVAGIPVTNASRTLSYTPTVDAVVVERILDAGGTIVGKLNLDDFSASGYGDTSVFGATRNPHAPAHAAGGSSSGAGAAVAAGLVDLAVGVDQGGSVRMPAAACGVVGLKATTGLVPSFGLSYIDHCFDCVGPIGRTVADVAALLGVIAGPDWRDPQWVRDLTLDDYAAGLADGVDGLRVAVLDEAIGDDACSPTVREGLEAAASALRGAGATVEHVSIPLWRCGFPIWLGTLILGWPQMLRSNGISAGHFGYVDVERVHAAGLVRRTESHLLPSTAKLALLVSSYLHERYQAVPLARAQNQRIALRRALDDAFERFDVLLTPTTPGTAIRLPEGRMTEEQAMARVVAENVLTCPLNVTGHPALAVPSGVDPDGLPTSVQLIGPRWGERRLLAAGAALEGQLDLDLQPA